MFIVLYYFPLRWIIKQELQWQCSRKVVSILVEVSSTHLSWVITTQHAPEAGAAAEMPC